MNGHDDSSMFPQFRAYVQTTRSNISNCDHAVGCFPEPVPHLQVKLLPTAALAQARPTADDDEHWGIINNEEMRFVDVCCIIYICDDLLMHEALYIAPKNESIDNLCSWKLIP